MTPMELLEERKIGMLMQRVSKEPGEMLTLLKDAGIYGVFAYALAFFLFYAMAVPIAEVLYHQISGVWLDPRALFMDGGQAKAETLALFASFYLLCKPFAPLRIGGALILTPDVKRFIEQRPALIAVLKAASTAFAPIPNAIRKVANVLGSFFRTTSQGKAVASTALRETLKDELLELAAKSKAGIISLDNVDQKRLEDLILVELPSLSPVDDPVRSELFSGEWECQWTNEKELNFAVRNGLFGLPWLRTYQTIDIPSSKLENVIMFKGGELRVSSSIAPDEADGTRFNFAFSGCSLKWMSIRVPFPPIGRGWGELLYLDGNLRIQRDVRGDVLVATKVKRTSE